MSSPSTARSTRSKASVAARPRPSEGRVIGLPSTTSTGLWAVRDVKQEEQLVAAPVSATDHSFMDHLELGALKGMHEQMQQRIALLEGQKGEALAAQASADGRVLTLEEELGRCRAAHAHRASQLERECAGLRVQVEQQATDLAHWPPRAAALEAQVGKTESWWHQMTASTS